MHRDSDPTASRRHAVALLAAAFVLQAQPAIDPWEALPRVTAFRAQWLERTEPLDPCSLSAALGYREVPEAALSDDAVRLQAVWRARRCDGASTPAAGGTVQLSALSIDADEARLELTVRKGERVHREAFTLRRRVAPFGWQVVEVRVYGMLQKVPPPAPPE